MSTDLARTDAAQAEIAEEFSFFGDWTERYQYLIDLGRKLPALPEAARVETWKVSGCQSQVWIVPHGDVDQRGQERAEPAEQQDAAPGRVQAAA